MGRKYKLFFKYLLSYLLILFVPLFIINGIYGRRVNAVYQEEIMSNIQTDLDILGSAVDDEIISMSNTVTQLAVLVDFNRFDFERNPLSAREIIQILSMFLSTNNFADEIVLYFHGDEYLVSSTTTCKVDTFARRIFAYKHSTPEEMKKLFNDVQGPIILPAQPVQTTGGTQEYITVLSPVYTDYQIVRGTCAFLIKTGTIQQMINDKLGKYAASVFVCGADGNLLYSTGDMDISKEDIVTLQNTNDPTKSYRCKETGQEYLVCNNVSDTYGYKFTALMPKNAGFAKRLGSINRFLISGTLLVVFIAMILIFILMRINYSPIRRLREKAASALPQHVNPKGEIEAISSTLDFLSDQNQYLTTKLESNVSNIKNIRLQELLTGRYKSSDEFNKLYAELHLYLPCNSFFVSCVLVHGELADWDSLADAIRAGMPENCTSYYVFTIQPHKLYFINCMPPMPKLKLVAQFEQMRNAIEAETGITMTIGLGSFIDGTEFIPKSFLEAGSALDYRFVKGNGNTILFDEVLSPCTGMAPYPRAEFDKLKNAIVSQNEECIVASINNLIEYMDKNNLPLFAAKGLCFDIVSAVLENASSGILGEAKASLLSLTEVDTAHEVVLQIRQLRDNLRSYAVPENSTDAKQQIAQIVEYVNSHCLRCDFSVQETSEHFNMQMPNLSQFFKDHTGQNILDYATNLRMERAKKLLAETNIPLKELGYETGYYNVSSFIRRFKQTQGLTPGDYRRLYGKGDSTTL
ncbi:MAG: AraC family transcriptional regulator [Oscillospiraceae bacterium]